MTERTSIEWADSTFNPWEGCTKVGPGCDHCYAEARNARFSGGEAALWGPGAPRRRTSAANWRKPVQWNATPFVECRVCHTRREWMRVHTLLECPGCGAGERDMLRARRRVFCASLADVFDNEVDRAWRADLFALIQKTPSLDWLLLTKRIGNAARMIDEAVGALLAGAGCPVWPWPNVWLGATIVNQAEAARDIPKLLATPAAVRFLSMEPLLGPVNIEPFLWELGSIDPETMVWEPGRGLLRRSRGRDVWVIVGGESGRQARPMRAEWARALRDQCAAAEVPFLFKQWGEWLGEKQDGDMDRQPLELNASDEPVRVGKKAAGRALDGRTHTEFPRSAP